MERDLPELSPCAFCGSPSHGLRDCRQLQREERLQPDTGVLENLDALTITIRLQNGCIVATALDCEIVFDCSLPIEPVGGFSL